MIMTLMMTEKSSDIELIFTFSSSLHGYAGNVQYPLLLGQLKVIALGTIKTAPEFNSVKYDDDAS